MPFHPGHPHAAPAWLPRLCCRARRRAWRLRGRPRVSAPQQSAAHSPPDPAGGERSRRRRPRPVAGTRRLVAPVQRRRTDLDRNPRRGRQSQLAGGRPAPGGKPRPAWHHQCRLAAPHRRERRLHPQPVERKRRVRRTRRLHQPLQLLAGGFRRELGDRSLGPCAAPARAGRRRNRGERAGPGCRPGFDRRRNRPHLYRVARIADAGRHRPAESRYCPARVATRAKPAAQRGFHPLRHRHGGGGLRHHRGVADDGDATAQPADERARPAARRTAAQAR